MESYDRELNRIRSLLKGNSKGLTVTEIARSIEINRNSVAKYLDVLRTSGQVEMKTAGSAKIFSLTKRIPVSAILSLSSDYILVLDDEFVITYVNEKVINFEKKPFDDLVGKTIDKIPVSFFSVPHIQALLRENISGNEISRELEVSNEGKTYFFRAKFVPSILENQKKGLLIILDDITEIRQYQHHLETTVAKQDTELSTTYRSLDQEIKTHQEVKDAFRESEKKYHNLIELAQEGVWTIEPDGTTTFSNAKLTEILGYTPEEMRGLSIYSFTDEKNTILLKKYIDLLKSGESGQYELVFLKKNGTPVYTRLSASAGKDEKGSFAYGLFLVSDISELREADEALRESELYYRTLIETSPNGIILTDPQGVIGMANIQASKMLGYKHPHEIRGKNLFDYVAPNDLEKCHINIERAAEKGLIKSVECSLISNENAAFCADINISAIYDRQGIPTSFVCVISDVTDRRRAEHLLRKSEEKHRALVEGISHIIFTTDTKGRITYVSPVIQNVLGYSPDELTGKHFYMLVPSDERQKLGLKLKEAQSGKFTPNDFRMIDHAGKIRWVRIIAQPLREKDKIIGITGLIGDINDWKQAEDALQKCELQFKAVVEDQTDLICRFSPDLKVTFVNPAYCRYYRKKPEDLLNQNFLSLIPEKSQGLVQKIISQVTPERPVRDFEHEIAFSAVDLRWHHFSLRAIFTANSEVMEYQSSSRDITELKTYFEKSRQLLQELQEHESELEKQNEELVILKQETERSEKKYLDLYDFAPVGYFTLDTEGTIIDINKTGAQLLAQSRDQMLGRRFQEFIPQEFLDAFRTFCRLVFESPKKQSCEVNLLRSGEPPIIIQMEGRAIGNGSEPDKRCRIVIIDVTERTIVRKALEESEGRLNAIIHGSPGPQFVIDKNHKVIYWNKAIAVCTGIGAKEVIGTNLHWKAFYPKERPCMADLMVDGTTESIEKWYPKKSAKSQIAEGAYEFIDFFPKMGMNGKWLHITATAIRDIHDNIIGALETIEDITDLKLAEESLKNATKKLNMLNSITRHDMLNQMTVLFGYMEIVEEALPNLTSVRESFTKVKESARAVHQLIKFTRDYQNLGVAPVTWLNLRTLVEKAITTVHPYEIRFDISLDSVELFADPLIEKVFINLIDNSVRHGKNVSDIRIHFIESDGNGLVVYEDNGVGIPAIEKSKLFNRVTGCNSRFGLYLSKEILNYTGISIAENGEPGKGVRFEIVVPRNFFRLMQ